MVACQRALEVVPDDPAVLATMGLAYAGPGIGPRRRRPIGSAYGSIRASPSRWPTWGLALEAQNDVAGAPNAYERALAVDPGEAVAMLDLGNLHFRQGNAERASEFYQQAIAVNASLAPAHFNLARVYALQGRLVQAKAQVE